MSYQKNICRKIKSMPSSPTIQPSYQSYHRLTQTDLSSDFSFFIKIEQGKKKNQVEIKTTLNKARVISQKVNAHYQADPTIQSIEISIPPHLNCLEEQTQLTEKVRKIFQSILESTNGQVSFSEEDLFLLAILMKTIGYSEQNEESNTIGLIKFISTISEAVSLLSTQFHSDAVKYLSMHFIEFLKSDNFENIDEEIILDIIDAYIEGKDEQNGTKEYEQIFKQFKDNKETIYLMHFLLHIDESLLNNDMTEYIIEHIDDRIAEKEADAFAEITKRYFQQNHKKNNKYVFNYTGSLQTIKIKEDGNYEIEAIGAAGSGGNTYGTNCTSQGGKGAKITANFALKQGDIIDIVVGGMGTSKQATAKDGTSGGGGGGTFIFKRITSITDERYQFAKGDIKYETLLVAAGGSGGEDSGYYGRNSFGHDGQASNYKSLNNFTEYSKKKHNCQSSYSIDGIRGITQFIEFDAKGSFFEQAKGFSRGGYGCGGSRNVSFAPGGGWCQGSNADQATSWSLDPKAVGTDGFNNGDGSATIKYIE